MITFYKKYINNKIQYNIQLQGEKYVPRQDRIFKMLIY